MLVSIRTNKTAHLRLFGIDIDGNQVPAPAAAKLILTPKDGNPAIQSDEDSQGARIGNPVQGDSLIVPTVEGVELELEQDSKNITLATSYPPAVKLRIVWVPDAEEQA